jgi:hypothetical protein
VLTQEIHFVLAAAAAAATTTTTAPAAATTTAAAASEAQADAGSDGPGPQAPADADRPNWSSVHSADHVPAADDGPRRGRRGRFWRSGIVREWDVARFYPVGDSTCTTRAIGIDGRRCSRGWEQEVMRDNAAAGVQADTNSNSNVILFIIQFLRVEISGSEKNGRRYT